MPNRYAFLFIVLVAGFSVNARTPCPPIYRFVNPFEIDLVKLDKKTIDYIQKQRYKQVKVSSVDPYGDSSFIYFYYNNRYTLDSTLEMVKWDGKLQISGKSTYSYDHQNRFTMRKDYAYEVLDGSLLYRSDLMWEYLDGRVVRILEVEHNYEGGGTPEVYTYRDIRLTFKSGDTLLYAGHYAGGEVATHRYLLYDNNMLLPSGSYNRSERDSIVIETHNDTIFRKHYAKIDSERKLVIQEIFNRRAEFLSATEFVLTFSGKKSRITRRNLYDHNDYLVEEFFLRPCGAENRYYYTRGYAGQVLTRVESYRDHKQELITVSKYSYAR